jgi:hypothetical protein
MAALAGEQVIAQAAGSRIQVTAIGESIFHDLKVIYVTEMENTFSSEGTQSTRPHKPALKSGTIGQDARKLRAKRALQHRKSALAAQPSRAW